MVKKETKMPLPKIYLDDDLFSTQEQRDDKLKEKVVNISLNDIDDFPKHPFKVIDNEDMKQMVESISENGVLVPTLVRPKENGKYEMISGHRRKFASELAGLETIPCIVRELTDDEATIIMVDSNLQREKILPSEKAFAYKLKMEALSHQGKVATSRPLVSKLETADLIGNDNNESGRQVYRYIRLTELIPQILQMVDNDALKLSPSMAFRPAVEISYLKEEEQKELLDIMECFVCTPSLSQAQDFKRLSKDNKLTREYMETILEQEKPNQIQTLKVNMDKLNNILPTNLTTNEERENYVVKAVSFYGRWLQKRGSKKRMKDNGSIFAKNSPLTISPKNNTNYYY